MDKVQLDQQILAIQRSTRTTFPFMLPLHDRMRMGFRWYYNWHTKSYASKVHWGMLVVAFLIGISTVVSSLVSFPKKVTASYVVTVATTTGVSPSEIASQRVIVKASSGTLVAFYWEDSDNSIRYKKSTDSGWTWSSATSITTTAGSADVAGSDFSVKIDGSDNIYVAWTADTRITTPSFVKLTYSAGSWTTGTIYTVSLLDTGKDRPVVTVESGGRIWVAYKENLSAIRASYSDNSGSSWTLTTPGTFNGAAFETPISSTIDLRGGYPFIIWDAGEDRDGLCHYNTWNGSAWGADTAIANTVFAGCAAPAMVVTSGGTVYAWSGSDFGYYDGSWHAAPDPGASNGSLTTDGTDVWAFWRDNTNNSLLFKKYTVGSSSWDSSATFVASANDGEAQVMQSGSSATLMPLIFYGTGEGSTMQVFYKNTGASVAPTAPVVTSPDGGETWGIGTTQSVTWNTSEAGRKYEVGQRLLDQYDNFNDNSINGTLWTKDDGSGLTIAETGNELKISGTSTALKTATLRSSDNTTAGADLVYQVKMKAPTAPPSGAWYGLQVHKASDLSGVRLTYSANGWDFSHYNGEWLSAGTTGALGNEGSSFITLKIVINRAAGKQYGYIITSSGEEIFIGASGENMGTNSRARLTAYVSAAAQTIDVRFEDYQLIPFNTEFSDNFDTETNGNPPANWTLSGDPTYGTITVSNVQYVSSPNSMKVSKNTTSGTLRAYKTLSSAQTGVIVAEWDWRAAQTNVVFINYLIGGGTAKTQVNLATSGYITYNYSGTSINIQTYSANTWYHMMIVADTQRQVHDIYIDGSLKASNIPFINAGTSLNMIDFRSANVTAGDFYVDNYQLYTDYKIISGLTATDAVSASWDTTGESAGTKYLARVRAYNDTTKFWGPYDYSNATFTLGNPPTAPSNVTLTNPSTSGMTVGWNDNSSDETGFKIERAQTTDCGSGSYAQIDTVGAGVTTYPATGLSVNTAYCFRVRAYNGYGDSSYATSTSPLYTLIETPTGISFDTITTSSLVLSATGSLSNLTAGTSGLWFNETSGNVGCSDSTGWTQTNSFTDDGLGPNVQCTYQVKARNGNSAETSYTATFSKYSLANPPINVSHSGNTISTVTWTWQTNSNPAGTEFYATDATGNSGWVADATSWASAGASANTPYTVTVKAKNGNGTETSDATANAYTSIQTPTGISFDTINTDSLIISATGTLSNLTAGSSGLWFDETSSNPGGSDSADWTNINSFTDNGLSPNVQYKYTAKARNGDTDETPETAESAKYTLAKVPGAPTVNTTSDISLTIIVDVNSNPSATQFAIYNETLNKWLKADGTLGATEVWQTYTQWGEAGGIVNTGLTASTTYAYKVKGINGDGTETALSPAGSAATSATPTTTPTTTTTTASTSSATSTVTTAGGNHAPVISHPLEDVSFCQQDSAYFVRNLPYYFVDPDHDPLTFSFTTIANTHLNVAILDGNYVEFSSKDKTWAGKENVTFSATDPSNASVSDTSQITVKSCPSPYGNHPPFITSTPPLTAVATEQYTYQVTATDADGDTLTYQLLVSPDGMIIDPQTGLIKFIPTLDQIGDWYIIIKVSDGKGGEDTQKYWLKVKSPFLPIKIAKQIVNIPQNYVIKDLTRNIVAPAAVGTAVASIIALALALPIAFTDLPFLFMRLWALILSRFRKKRPPWGRVLDASDKKPIVGAIVRIYEAEFNKLKEMQVTDKEGRFGFMVKPGRYYVTVDKPGYVFRPNLVPGEGVYQGGVFEIKENQPTVALDIYLEAIEKPLGKLRSMRLRLWHNIQYVMDKIDTPLLIVGSALALFAAWILPSPFNFLVVVLYILMIGLKILLRYSSQRPFGRVYDRGNNQPIDLVTVRMFNSEKGTLSATKVTDKMGRFQFMVPVGVYYLMANKAGYGTFTTKPFAVNQKVGIINIDIRLARGADKEKE